MRKKNEQSKPYESRDRWLKGSGRRRKISCLVLLSALFAVPGARPSGVQEITDITGFRPSPVPNEFIAKVTPIFWDARCMPVILQMNSTLDPIPNPLGKPFLTVAQARATLQAAADLWGAVPTSYARVTVSGTTKNPGAVGLDTINEVTFRTNPGFPPPSQQTISAIDFGAIATLRTTRLVQDFEFKNGLDLDRDGDSDVSDKITTCQDVDGDGDIEMPAGMYHAGTIIDSDIIFNTGVSSDGKGPEGFRFTIDPAAIDSDPRSVDFFGIAVQIIGDFLGVAHVPTNQRSAHDGHGSTMFPYIDTGDPEDEKSLRTLDMEAIVGISRIYPKGSATTGPAALGPGDLSFKDTFGFITGEIRLGSRDEPLLGGIVYALDHKTGAVVTSTTSGTSQLSVTANTLGGTFLDARFHAINGKYTLVVPPGIYDVFVAPIDEDGTPIRYYNVNLESQLTHYIHQNDFEEKFYNGKSGGKPERLPKDRPGIAVKAGQTVAGIDIVTDRTVKIANYGSFDQRGFATASPGTFYAVRIPKDQLLAASAEVGKDGLIQGGAFLTGVEDSSVVPLFSEASFTTGVVHADGSATLDLAAPIERQLNFVGRDFDFAPLWFTDPVGVTQRVRRELAGGNAKDYFLVLRLPRKLPYPGVSGAAPEIGLDGGVTPNDVPINGLSYSSPNGKVFQPSREFNYMFKLVLRANRK